MFCFLIQLLYPKSCPILYCTIKFNQGFFLIPSYKFKFGIFWRGYWIAVKKRVSVDSEHECTLENQTVLKHFHDRSASVSMWAIHELTSAEPMITIDSMKSHLIHGLRQRKWKYYTEFSWLPIPLIFSCSLSAQGGVYVLSFFIDFQPWAIDRYKSVVSHAGFKVQASVSPFIGHLLAMHS